jgi:hypothetical protein
MRKSKFNLGDVFELKSIKGYLYIQYVYNYDKPPYYGQLVRILNGFYKNRPTDLSKIVDKTELYYQFVPLELTATKLEIKCIGNYQIPTKFKTLPVFRMAGLKSHRSSKSDDWYIWEDNKETKVGELKNNLRRINSLGTSNIQMIIEKAEMGWLPEYDISVIGFREYYQKFYPEATKCWNNIEQIIKTGDLQNIAHDIANKSGTLIKKYDSNEINLEELDKYFSYLHHLFVYYAVSEITDEPFSLKISKFREQLKKLTRYLGGFDKNQPDLQKLKKAIVDLGSV